MELKPVEMQNAKTSTAFLKKVENSEKGKFFLKLSHIKVSFYQN